PTEHKSRQQRIRARLIRMISYRLPRLIGRFQPDVLIHTHFLPPEILSALGQRQKVPQAVVVTDFAAHSLWLQPRVARYYVATEDVAVHLRSVGVDAGRIRITGIPIDPAFEAPLFKYEARARLSLPAGRDVLLVMAGGLSKPTLLELVRQLRDFRHPLTAVIVCGRSLELLGRLQAEVADARGLVQFRLLGFTQDIRYQMAAADLMVGKPGGLTTSEALASALPMAVVQPYPIQEEANANFLLEHGAAMRIEPLSVFSHKLRTYFDDPARREGMRVAALKLAKPGASREIVRTLLDDPL
ncbi:MAG TPA: glycosyltransferase, partial [Trueperaceae bacterium]